MRVYIGPYKNWIGPYQICEFLKYFGISKETRYNIADKLSNTFIYDICSWIDSKKKRNVKIEIHKYDTVSVDATLSLIIRDLLYHFKKHNTGFPSVDLQDVPEDLRSGENSAEARWDWILDEMIWTFQQIHPDYDWEEEYHIKDNGIDKFDDAGLIQHQLKINNGLRLFGRYYQNLWR